MGAGSWGYFDLETWSAYDPLTDELWSNVVMTVWPADNGYWPFLPGQQVTISYYKGELNGISTNTVGPPPVESMEQSAASGSCAVWPGVVTYSESSGRDVGLFTGGQATRESKVLLELSASLIVEGDVDPATQQWPDDDPPYEDFNPFLPQTSPPVDVPSDQISLDPLGNLGSGGSLLTAQPKGIDTRITPRAPGRYRGPLPQAEGWQLLTQTASVTPTNRQRTTLGVGEEVDVYLYSSNKKVLPDWSSNVLWTTSAGSVSPTNGWATTLTAPSNAASVTVTMHYRTNTEFSTNFTVVEPANVIYAVKVGLQDYT